MLVIAHRGASVAARENTPGAFELAREMGADAAELDVRDAADGSLVVRHDALPASAEDQRALPRLPEVLDACDGLLVNVEIKNLEGDVDFAPTVEFVERVLEELAGRGDPGRWVISSFSRATIDHCRVRVPEIATAFLVDDPVCADLGDIAAAGHAALHPDVRYVDAALVERCHAVGLTVNTWTCNDPERIAELDGLGVDGVCTDVPDVALAALGRSGPLTLRRWGRPG